MSDFVEHGTQCCFDNDDSWVILSPIEQKIKKKIEAVGTPLRDWDISIYRGILTGYNDAFIIDGKKRDELIAEDPKSAEIIRPILRGRDIKRYQYENPDLWIIATFPSMHYDIDAYPAIKKYLLSFGIERLEQTGKEYVINGSKVKARKKTHNKWFETQDSIAYWEDFSKQKIVWGNLCLSAQFAYADEGYFINAPSPMIVPGNKYILAVLNSRVADWYIRQLGVTRNGGYFEYKPMFIEKLPIPQINSNEQEEFIDLVDAIITGRKMNCDTSLLEEKIDNLVYSLYGLSDDEIVYLKSK